MALTHRGRVMHICISKLTIISSDNGLLPGRRQAIIGTNTAILFIGPIGNKLQWNLNQNLYIFIQENAFENVIWKMAPILSQLKYVKKEWHLYPRMISIFHIICDLHALTATWLQISCPHDSLSALVLNHCRTGKHQKFCHFTSSAGNTI